MSNGLPVKGYPILFSASSNYNVLTLVSAFTNYDYTICSCFDRVCRVLKVTWLDVNWMLSTSAIINNTSMQLVALIKIRLHALNITSFR